MGGSIISKFYLLKMILNGQFKAVEEMCGSVPVANTQLLIAEKLQFFRQNFRMERENEENGGKSE